MAMFSVMFVSLFVPEGGCLCDHCGPVQTFSLEDQPPFTTLLESHFRYKSARLATLCQLYISELD